MSDLSKVVPITDFKVSVKHHFNNFKLVLDAPFFSEVYSYYSEQKKEGTPVKKHHSLKTLLDRLNNIKTPRNKSNSIAILKGLYEGGTSGQYCVNGAPFLFFDIDVKDKENPHLLDAHKNALVFDYLKEIAVIVWRSNSGKGMAGVVYVPQLSALLNKDRVKHIKIGNAITDYLEKELNVNAKFDQAQNKFRQIRYLALQSDKREINHNPYVFEYEIIEVAKVSNTGVKQYRFIDNRAVNGSIQDQFNRDTPIHTALLDNGFCQVNDQRYKHQRTNSKTTGVVQNNVFFNHSSSFSDYKVFTPFWLYYTEKYGYDLKRFIKELTEQGYKEIEPKKKAFKNAQNTLEKNHKDREKVIFLACYDLQNASYKEKIKFIEDNANDDAERLLFYDYLKIKPLTIEYNKTINIKNFVSEGLRDVLNYADQNKKIVLQAETGTGKTTAFLKYFSEYRQNKRLLILAPLTAIVEQNKNEFSNIVALTGNSEPSEHTRAKTWEIVMATYEQGYKHLSTGNKFDYVVIDEVHNLISSHSFKRESIKNLTSVLRNCKMIGLTGTTNPLFKSLGYKLVNIKKKDLSPVNVSMKVDNRSPVKIALQHLKDVKGKCIIRINSKDDATEIKKELISKKRYSKNEILILKSDAHIKKSADFIKLTQRSCFNDSVKLVLTTSLIDEGLSIKQEGFSDVVFIENTYKPMPEAVKQFFARFRNQDSQRKNYLYFRETKDQSLNSWNPFFAFNKRKDELIEDAKGRNVNESKSRDIANDDYLFYPNGKVNDYALAYDISTEFFKRATTMEFVNFLRINYNLNIVQDDSYTQQNIDVKDLKESRDNTKKQIGFNWLNNYDDVLDVLYQLTDKKEIKNTICYTGMNPSDELFNLVYDNLNEFERLHKNTLNLESLNVENAHSKIIDHNTFKPIGSKTVNSRIRLLENLETINNPKTKTDEINKRKLLSFVNDVSKLDVFNSADLVRIWKKQRSKSVNYNSDNLRELVLNFHSYREDKKRKVWFKF